MRFCDDNPNIIAWGSEEIKIKYLHPIKRNQDGSLKICTYIPDFIIKYKNKEGALITEIVEIKPSKQATISKRMSTYDKIQLVINDAKWRAAQAFCKQSGIKFRVITEKDMWK